MSNDSKEKSIIGAELFRKVFKKNISDDLFYHKHYDNPHVMYTPCIIEKKENKPIGMHWMMRQRFSVGDNRLTGVQGSDDAVLTEERGGLTFLKMRMQSVKTMKEEGADFEFGCFAKGEALAIAETFGEKETVDLDLARLFLKEHKHRWKRFDIPYPTFFSDILYCIRKRKIQNVSDKTLDVSMQHSCHFNELDYAVINSNNSLHVIRDKNFYQWKLEKKDKNAIEFVVARQQGDLVGYLIMDLSNNIPKVIDWDIITAKNKVSVLASLFAKCIGEYEYIDIPYLNKNSGEMDLFTKIGCTDMSKLWAPACICVKPINEKCRDLVTNPFLWKLRLIDADYYLNT